MFNFEISSVLDLSVLLALSGALFYFVGTFYYLARNEKKKDRTEIATMGFILSLQFFVVPLFFAYSIFSALLFQSQSGYLPQIPFALICLFVLFAILIIPIYSSFRNKIKSKTIGNEGYMIMCSMLSFLMIAILNFTDENPLIDFYKGATIIAYFIITNALVALYAKEEKELSSSKKEEIGRENMVEEMGGENMTNEKKSDYELSRANFSATAGLGFLALGYAIKDNTDLLVKLAAVFLSVIGLFFWIGASNSYLRHFSYRGKTGSWNIQSLKDHFGI